MEKKKAKKFPLFWCLYVLFILAMIIFWVCIISYVKKSLLIYEASQPAQKMEEVMEQLKATGLSQYLSVDQEISRFETKADYVKEFESRTAGSILFYTQDKSHYDVSAPRYEIYANGDLAAYLTLKEVSSQPLMVILSLSQWEIGEVETIGATAKHRVRIKVPDNYQVHLNGIPMDEREMLGDREVSEDFVYAAEYVDVPGFITYEAEGLLYPPKVDIYDQDGRPVAFESMEENGLTEVSLGAFEESTMPEDLMAMALEHAQRYTNFFSADLEGSRQSTRPIRDMFPEGSYYLQLAETYRREDMWTYTDHNTPVFSDQEVSHYIRYSEDLFSCEIFFNKTMVLKKTNSKRVDTTHSRVYYGRVNGEWKILDIKTLSNNENE